MTAKNLLPLQSIISTPVAKGQNSKPQDIMNTREILRRLNRYKGDITKGYMDAGLETALRNFQKDEGLTADGTMYPNGETERALNRNLFGETNAFGSAEAARIDLSKNVGDGQANNTKDVKQIQKGLATLGFIPKSRGFEANGILDKTISEGIRIFQKKNELRVDGKLKPGGETEKALNIALRQEVGDRIDSESLPPLNLPVPRIPSTNIPDYGVPEDNTQTRIDRILYDLDMDKEMSREPPTKGRDSDIERNGGSVGSGGNGGFGGGGFNT